jgi:hypothetical protein
MRRKVLWSFLAILALLVASLLGGCGSGKKGGTSDPIVGASRIDNTNCTNACHAASLDPVSGSGIVTDWTASLHNTNPYVKVDCQSCHGGGSLHYGTGPIPYPNPDSAGQCFSCHKAHLPAAHYYEMSTTQQDPNNQAPAMYATLNYQSACTSCHDPHKAGVGEEHTDWAASGHGDVNGAAWSDEDFKANTSCIRCHTSTGFINYVQSGYTLPTQTWATSGDPTREVLTCKACHTSFNFKNSVRSAGAFTAPYNNGKSPATFPDATTSNLCIPCHAGRESGATVQAVTDFTNVSFKNSHYIAAAGLMYVKAGFTDFVPASTPIGTSTYGDSLTSTDDGGKVSSTHRNLGTTNSLGHGLAAGTLSIGGPCVTCHIKGENDPSLTALPARTGTHSLAISASAFTQVCIKCHDSEGGTALDGTNFKTVFLEPQSEVFQNALKLAETLLLNNYNIKYDPNTYPYFYDLTKDPSGKTAVKDWTRGTNDQSVGEKVMGACFNINLLTKEPAAYVHARTYVRRLLYDTIDFLDDGTINLTVGATAQAQSLVVGSPVFGLYVKGTTASAADGTTESMTYLLGYNRTSLVWNTLERP